MALTSKTLAEAITFTRSSKGGYYDLNGRYTLAAANEPRIDFDPSTGEKLGLLVEESRTNLFTGSEQLNSGLWTKFQSKINQNSIIAPDGTVTADKLVEDNSSGFHHVSQNALLSDGVQYTLSVFAKKGERDVFFVEKNNSPVFRNGKFDLTSGAIISSANVDDAKIKDIGGGWFLCSITWTQSGAGQNHLFQLNLNSSTRSYTGDGVSGLYLWGAQVEEGAFPTSYIPSTETFTSRASTATYYDSAGVLQTAAIDVERINYNPADLTAPGKQLFEESRTNILFPSDMSTHSLLGMTKASTTGPDNSSDALRLTEDTATTQRRLRDTTENPINAAIGETITASMFVRPSGNRTNVALLIGTNVSDSTIQEFDLSAKQTLTSSSADGVIVGANIQELSNGWFRLSFTLELTVAITTAGLWLFFSNVVGDGNASYTGDGSSYIDVFGAQIEKGDYSTSYISTTAAQVTRSADVFSSSQSTRAAEVPVVNGFSDWYNQAQGTMFFEAHMKHEYSDVFLGVSSGSSDDAIYSSDASNKVRANIVAGGASSAALDSTNNFPIDQSFKFAMAFDSSGLQAILEGDTVKSDNSVTIASNMATMKLGCAPWGTGNQMNGHLKSVKYYARKLSQTELEGLVA